MPYWSQCCELVRKLESEEYMTKALNLLNQRFGKLLAIAFAGALNGERMWQCLCDCGKITIVRQGHLRSGHTTSCGCNKQLLRSLIGLRFGSLVVVNRAEDYVAPRTKRRYTQWLCLCDCGNKTVVLSNNLRSGSIKSCGCKSPHKLQDLSGRIFGKLTVLHMTEPYINLRGRRLIQYLCQCECGNQVYELANTLRSGDVTSCGCSVMSKGELLVAKWLAIHHIEYESHKSFPDCLSNNGYRLNFDFYIPDKHVLIECNGIQHYTSVDFFGGDEQLLHQRQNDYIKEKYANNKHFRYLVLDCRKNNLRYAKVKLDLFFREY